MNRITKWIMGHAIKTRGGNELTMRKHNGIRTELLRSLARVVSLPRVIENTCIRACKFAVPLECQPSPTTVRSRKKIREAIKRSDKLL